MIGAVVDLELARQQWADGRRALARAQSDPAAYRRLLAGVDVVLAELTRRLGQNFTLAELADAYRQADRWTLEAIDDAFDDGPSPPVSATVDAAFDQFSRRASNYAP
jgi:hypothetical protein